jgi:quercetin dioxygenase-like cupin family protein
MRVSYLTPSLTLVFLIGLAGSVGIAQQIPDSVAADPAQHKIEFENDIVRIVRIKYAPSAKAAMHTHPAHCLTFITGGNLRLTMADGKSVDAALTRGAVECNGAVVHAAQNVGESPVEIVAVEFKNRQALNK